MQEMDKISLNMKVWTQRQSSKQIPASKVSGRRAFPDWQSDTRITEVRSVVQFLFSRINLLYKQYTYITYGYEKCNEIN